MAPQLGFKVPGSKFKVAPSARFEVQSQKEEMGR